MSHPYGPLREVGMLTATCKIHLTLSKSYHTLVLSLTHSSFTLLQYVSGYTVFLRNIFFVIIGYLYQNYWLLYTSPWSLRKASDTENAGIMTTRSGLIRCSFYILAHWIVFSVLVDTNSLSEYKHVFSSSGLATWHLFLLTTFCRNIPSALINKGEDVAGLKGVPQGSLLGPLWFPK